jgi:hypothetical protein
LGLLGEGMDLLPLLEVWGRPAGALGGWTGMEDSEDLRDSRGLSRLEKKPRKAEGMRKVVVGGWRWGDYLWTS